MKRILLALLLLSTAAVADTLVLNFAPPPPTNAACPCNKDWEATIRVPQFDPVLGTLRSARFEVVVNGFGPAGAALLAENVTNAPVYGAEAAGGVVFVYRFKDTGEWVYGGAEQVCFGGPVGRPATLMDAFQWGRAIAPFDGALDYLGASAGGLCIPNCGLNAMGANVWDFQLPRFVGTGTVDLLYQPRMHFWRNKAAQRLAWALSVPVQPLEARVIYEYEPRAGS